VRFSALAYFYGRRLRTYPVQELLAGAGIAIGVALVFAVQVANSSITSGSSEIVQSIVGAANLQLSARGPAGLNQHLAERVGALPGVEQVAPVLDLNGTVRNTDGRSVAVQVVSAAPTLAALDGLARSISMEKLSPNTVMLPSATADALGVSTTLGSGISEPLPVVSLLLRGRAVPVKVSVVLGSDTVGDLSNAMAAIAPLRLLQRIAGLQDRVSSVLVETKRGARRQVQHELETLAAGRLTVSAATEDVQLLKQATIPNAQATGFFAAVSALVGMLLAFNAMLLSAPERRRVIADLRIEGARPRDLVKLLMFQSLCLGFIASIAGVLLGDVLSRNVFHETPGYLAAAFPLGAQTVIGWKPVAFSIVGGVVATCLAAGPPLLDLRRARAVDGVYFEGGEPGHAMSTRSRAWLFGAAVALVGASEGALLVLGPDAAVGAIAGLAFAALLAIPLGFTIVVWVAERIAAQTRRLNMLLVATRALRATTVRALALAATGAIALFGSVAAEGAHRDLLNGLYGAYGQYVSTADLWVTNQGDVLATDSFPEGDVSARIARIYGVVAIRSYQGGFLDVGGRRVWVIARSPSAGDMLAASQVVQGSAALATSRLRAGGWIAVSQQIAQADRLKLGQVLTLPTPTGPVGYRIAVTTTNLGWSAGAIVLNDSDYRRAWATSDPTALEIDTAANASLAAVQRSVQSAIGGHGGLQVQTSAERAAQADALAREGLSRLTEISLLLIVAAALAMAAAMGASIWQRRRSLASLRIQSFQPPQLRVILLCESGLVLGTGCLVGALVGTYGHALIGRYLRLVTGFPAPFSVAAPQTIETVAAVVAVALIVLAVPGYVASQVSPSLALQE
jgi:putative ABC transport system permease protein